MPSEYDFLSPYSRRLRRIGLAATGLAAFLAGAVAMAAIVALPLFPLNGDSAAATDGKPGAATHEPARAAAATPPTSGVATNTGSAGTERSPQGSVADTGARRETTGVAGMSAPPSSGEAVDAEPPIPLPPARATATGQAQTPVPRDPVRTGETTPAAAPAVSETSARAADTSEAPQRSQQAKEKKLTASRTRRARSERAARSRALSERRTGREYVDGNGVRYFVVPRSAESAFAYDDDTRRRRLIIVRPGPFDDGF